MAEVGSRWPCSFRLLPSRKHRRNRKETFIPLAHDPGVRLEADFGHIHVDFPDGRRLVPVLINALSK